jgi:hypothetical protein
VSIYLEEHADKPAARTKTQVRRNVTGNEADVVKAADRLVSDGYASLKPGPKGWDVYESLKSFRGSETGHGSGD